MAAANTKVVAMKTYRLQPDAAGRTWGIAIGIAAVVLILPVVVWLLAPAPASSSERVVIDEGGWNIALDAECEANPLPTGLEGWDCGGVGVETMTESANDDPDLALRRMTRALGGSQLNTEDRILREGDTRMLIDGRSFLVGMSVQGSGEQDGTQLFVVLNATAGNLDHLASLSAEVYQGLNGEELPEFVTGLIADMGQSLLPGWLTPELRRSPEVAL